MLFVFKLTADKTTQLGMAELVNSQSEMILPLTNALDNIVSL